MQIFSDFVVMKMFVIKIFILLFLVAAYDYVFGSYMNYVINRIDVGGQGRDNYICNKTTENILIFGSSRAVHHYNSRMIEDSLHMSCYNCGEDGNGIILNYARLLMAEERSKPDLIICDIEATFDLLKNDNMKYVGWLRPRYDRKGIADIFNDIDCLEKYKMACQMYRYNSKFFQNLFVYNTSITSDTGIKGYRPLNGELDPMKIKKTADIGRYEIDDLKLKYIHKFIDLSQGSRLYFIVSPKWYGADTTVLVPIENICKEKNIFFMDFSNDAKYVHNDKLFVDGNHLNSKGADEFTRDLIKIIKKDL